MESKISLSQISLSANQNWGPDPSFVFEQYRNLPFAPFNKLEKLGKFCDISNPVSKPVDSSKPQEDGPHDFITIEPDRPDKPLIKPQSFRPQYRPNTRPQVRPNVQPFKPRPNYHPRIQTVKTKFKDNTGVQSDWVNIKEANKTDFDKTPVSNIKVIELGSAGKIPEYDRSLEGKRDIKKSPVFTLPNTITLNTGPRSDKYMQELIEKNRKSDEITIYATDVILSAVLTAKNSVFPWDITVIKEGNQIFLEPSEYNKVNYIDILTVNENTAGSLPEDEKEMLKLCIESTNVNRKFIELATKTSELKEFNTDEATSIQVPEKKVYRYRKWTLDNKINLVVRSEVDAYLKEGQNTPFVKLCALNECQPKDDWKQSYELNKGGALFSSELRNNLCKVCKWLCQANLAECNTLKIGFITKPNPKEPKYAVLMVEDMSATTLANTINFRIKDSWSIIKTLALIMQEQEDGVYSFVKSAYKQSIKIYQVPEKEEQVEA